MLDDYIPQLRIDVNGIDLSADVYDLLTEVRAESSLQLPDQVRLRFLDADFGLYDSAPFSVGDVVEVYIGEGRGELIADGDVTAVGVEPGPDGVMTMAVSALGVDHRLARGVGLATFVDQTDGEIVEAIARQAGLDFDGDSTSTTHPYVMQACPANVFIDERAALVGYRWWVEGRTLHFKQKAPETPGPELRWGEDLLRFRVMASSAGATNGVTVRSWDPSTQQDLVGSASVTPSLASVGTDASGPVGLAGSSKRLAESDRFTSSGSPRDVTAANELATSLAKRAASTAVAARATALGNPQLRAGRVITISDVGDRLSGKYLLANVEHVYDASSGYLTRFSTGGQEPSGLVDLLGSRSNDRPWSPGQLVVGLVTDIADPDWPSRIKVRFPTFSDEFESAWARVTLPGAGPDRGLQILPEIGDEVLVGFESGDAGRPVVLGGLWSQQIKPPLANDDVLNGSAVAVRTWKSRAGHSITINDDSDDPDAIVIALADGTTTMTIAQDRVDITTPSDITVSTDKNATISAKGDLTLEGNKVTITAQSSVDLSGAEVNAKASGGASIEGGTTSIKASGGASIDGGASTAIKGGMVSLN